jgi:hypothetical protein
MEPWPPCHAERRLFNAPAALPVVVRLMQIIRFCALVIPATAQKMASLVVGCVVMGFSSPFGLTTARGERVGVVRSQNSFHDWH